jgi:hypothetical protein
LISSWLPRGRVDIWGLLKRLYVAIKTLFVIAVTLD